MAETQRTIAEMQTLLANNATGDVSATDLRDLMATLRSGHGEMAITSSSTTTPDNTTSYKQLAGTYALTAGAHNWDMNTDGQLRYIGVAARDAHVSLAISFTAGTNNQIIHFRLEKNGTSIAASEAKRKIGTGSDVGAIALHGHIGVVTNDYLTIGVRNETSTGTITADHASMFCLDKPT